MPAFFGAVVIRQSLNNKGLFKDVIVPTLGLYLGAVTWSVTLPQTNGSGKRRLPPMSREYAGSKKRRITIRYLSQADGIARQWALPHRYVTGLSHAWGKCYGWRGEVAGGSPR
jgi:hypothetical protein